MQNSKCRMQNFGALRADYKLQVESGKLQVTGYCVPIIDKVFEKRSLSSLFRLCRNREGDRLVSRCFLVLPISVPET